MWRPELPLTSDAKWPQSIEWLNRQFRRLSLWSDSLQGELGYGGMIQRAPVAIADIAVGNYAVVPFDEGLVSVPYLVTQDPDNDQFRIDQAGLWFIASYGAFTFTKNAANDRQIYVRFYNVTDSAPISANPFPMYAESNTTGATWSFTTLLEAPESLVSKAVQMEIGGSAHAFAGITLDKAGLTLVRVPTTRSAYTTFLLPSP